MDWKDDDDQVEPYHDQTNYSTMFTKSTKSTKGSRP